MTTAPSGWPAPPVKRAPRRRHPICSGSDGIRDLWSPYGNADMLERARHVGQRNGLDKDHEVGAGADDLHPRRCQGDGLANYGVAVGNDADLVLVQARNVPEAVVLCPPRQLVVKRGKVVARDGHALCEAP